MRVSVFDYGAGNLHSLCKALTRTGATVSVETDARRCLTSDLLVLPGVGAFGPAAARLAPARAALRDALADGHPALAICLGMQLLLEGSDEGAGPGIGLVAGRVTRLAARRVPHIGWNTVDTVAERLLAGRNAHVYYANGFACRPADAGVVTAWTTHDGDRFPAVLRVGRTIGVQFHPEKSGVAGLRLLGAVLEEARCA